MAFYTKQNCIHLKHQFFNKILIMDPFLLKSGLNLGPGEERQACLSGAQVSVVLFLITGTENIYLLSNKSSL